MKYAKEYLTNATMSHKRKPSTAYEIQSKISNKWTPVPRGTIDLCGNVRPSYNKVFSFIGDNYSMFEVIPSSLLLYKLLCLYKAKVHSEGPEGYKTVWSICLQHKKTKEILMFSEWKGAAGIWTRFYTQEELPQAYKEDLIELLNHLVSDNCLHPYDGLVAGSVA
jgi:hypothetical protein